MSERSLAVLGWMKAEWLLLVAGTLALALALVDPQPLSRYGHWLQLPTLAGLLGLLIAIQGIRDSGVVQRAAAALAGRMHSVRALGLLLVGATAVLSMVLTNDVSLFLIVPLTLALGEVSDLPVLRMVVLEALAVNSGSALSPIGNPQNLLLWQHAGVSFAYFVIRMLPPVLVMLLLLLALTCCWLSGGRIGLEPGRDDRRPSSTALALTSAAALLGMVLLMEAGHAVSGAVALVAACALLRARLLLKIDWLLLLTFAAIFLGVGHLGALPLVQHALARLDFSQPLTLYLSGIVASQLISNVPATVLLLDRAPHAMALAVAVNVGGFGVVIGSMANLIALRLAQQRHGLRTLQLVSVPFLLVCAPAVYVVWRWLG